MQLQRQPGYTGKLLWVDLTCGSIHEEILKPEVAEQYLGGAGQGLETMKNVFTGVGPFLHNDPIDRPPEVFGKNVSLHFDKDKQPYVLVPIIPD